MTFLLPIAFLGLGVAVGTLHFLLLARDTRLLVDGGSIVRFVSLRIVRLALAAAAFALAAWVGWPSLLAAAAGFMAARQWALKRFGAVS